MTRQRMRDILVEELQAAEGLPVGASAHILRLKYGLHGPAFEAVFRAMERVANGEAPSNH